MPYWENGISPTERFKALVRGEKLDRIPVGPGILGFAAKMMGYKTLGELYEYPKVWMSCLMTVIEMYQLSGWEPMAMSGTGPLWMGAWGSKFMYPYEPKMGSLTLTEPAVKKPEDVEKLEVPDPAPYIAPQYECIELALERGLYPLVPIMGSGTISGAAYSITEPETFMFWIIKEPDLCHKVLDLSTEYGIRWAELLVKKFGAESWIPWLGNPTDSNILISADVFAKFPLPRMIKFHRKVLEMGVPFLSFHWCGDHKLTIEAGHVEKVPMGEPGIVWFGPEVPIDQLVERFGKKYVIQGNVDTTATMVGPFNKVVELCRKNIEVGMKAPKGYILSCGCEFPPPTPAAHAYAFTKAAREYGKY